MAFTVVPIPKDEISQRLETGWGVEAATITELYLGTGGDTGTFRADALDHHYFLKLAKAVSETGIAVSLLLADQRVPAVAPILSAAGNAWETIAGYLMVVYPMIDGSPIVPEHMTELDWHAVGIALRAVHDTSMPSELRDTLPSDGIMFAPWGEDFLSSISSALSHLGGKQTPFSKS